LDNPPLKILDGVILSKKQGRRASY
jgi:hypothetical protein